MNLLLDVHMIAMKHILRYVKATASHDLSFKRTSNNLLHGYSNSDWRLYVDDQKFTTGFVIFLGDNLISWSSRKQPARCL